MKRSVVLLMLAMATLVAAQQEQAASAPEVKLTNIVGVRREAPTYSDVYCAGFITPQPLQKVGYVADGWDTPHQVRFSDREYVYMEGSGFAIGSQYALVRQERDLNRYEAFHGQYAQLRQLGRLYADVGRVRVVAIHNNIAITQVEFNCTDIMDGDAAIPFAERQTPQLHAKINFDRFAPPNGKLTGKIVMAKGFDTIVGTGRKVYLNIGANQGVKMGDYFRAVRTYDSYRNDDVDYLSFKASYYDDNQVPAGRFSQTRVREFPRISLGEMVVLSVTPTSSTAMVTLSLEDIHVGDGVELEADSAEIGVAEPVVSPLPQQTAQTPETPASAEAAAPAGAPAQQLAVACSAEPAAVHAGESSTITCEASSADHRPLSFRFSAANARLVQRDNTAVLDTRDLAAGPVEVLATVSDDRNLTATAKTTINVDAPRAALVPSKLNYVSFARDSARLDNSSKAVLDGVALRLARDTDSSLVVLGLVESGENRDLAQQRAASTAEYLTKDKGIDDKRLQLRDGGEYGGKAELWMVPPGTKLQEADLQH